MAKSSPKTHSSGEKATQNPPQNRRLGRGLGSLLAAPVRINLDDLAPAEEARTASPANLSTEVAPLPAGSNDGRDLGGLRMIPTASIQPNRMQPRQHFDETSLATLAQSIREAGMMQPLVVRPGKSAGEFELIAGERRWRAAGIIGLAAVPAIVRDVDDKTSALWALIENLHREDLNPIDRATAFKRMCDEFHMTHQDIADRVMLDRTTVTNHLRLLELDELLRESVAKGLLNLGHARALLSITNLQQRARLAADAIRDRLSVREVEKRARSLTAAPRPARAPSAALTPGQAHLETLQKALGEHLGTKVAIQRSRGKSGKLIIDFYDLDHFDGLLARLGFNPDSLP